MKKVAIIFGGASTEHDISILSAKSIFENIDRCEYNVSAIYIDKNGIWYKYDTLNLIIQNKIEDLLEYIKSFNVIFPVLHGRYGEDGTIQGMLDMLNVSYVGCGVLASSICMDKIYSKLVFKQAGFNQAKFVYFKKQNQKYIFVHDEFEEKCLEIKEIYSKVEKYLTFPLFVKPANSGSSIGISKVETKEQLEKAINIASKYDDKILIEEMIYARELECGVLQADKMYTSVVGEIITCGNFYDYNFKYKNNNQVNKIPADISSNISDKIQELSLKAFNIVDAKEIARIDFFLDENDKIYINEINTMPGFTNSSMYPKLFEKSGIAYKDLITMLIENSKQI